MRPKEIAIVAIGAIVLTNLSVVGTLFATGHFSSDPPAASEVPQDEPENPDPAVTEAVPPPPEPKPALHSMSQAMYICEDKVVSSNSGKHIAYELDPVASRFSEEEQVYRIFIETKTISRVDAPQETAKVSCEVAAETMSIVGYKAMKNKN
ncbi:hypothetical protein G8764_10940 [Pseudomaricurvus alcaniphilus]|uniref:hypothetical protein n=1 Tax=Pseudomaricurvus alcaniphilus TaxID=1166482 RepID=UPI00140A407B|nr:hypothetical protein [Pseudomaricurvus alcaniphilus]NHN37813.1 hypothetical protein [Pseudomaricurvus alcaniphilus]